MKKKIGPFKCWPVNWATEVIREINVLCNSFSRDEDNCIEYELDHRGRKCLKDLMTYEDSGWDVEVKGNTFILR